MENRNQLDRLLRWAMAMMWKKHLLLFGNSQTILLLLLLLLLLSRVTEEYKKREIKG